MTLSAYLLAALLTWSPSKSHPNEEKSAWEARARDIAADVADVVTAKEEPSCGTCAVTGLRLLGLGFMESNYDLIVEQGHCRPHTCDSGTAWSAWQIHTGKEGLTFEGTKYMNAADRPRAWLEDHFAEIVLAPQLVSDRKVAAKMALHMFRASPGNFSTWHWVRDLVSNYAAARPFK